MSKNTDRRKRVKKQRIVGVWGAKPLEDMTEWDFNNLDKLEKDWTYIYEDYYEYE